jgi:hypothetical protein
MGTTRSFQTMLNQYLPNELLREELVKRDWILQNVERDDSWKGGDLVVPFRGARASSVAFGGLTAASDIAQDNYVRGTITGGYPEVWGSMLFNHKDIIEHDKISEQNFLKLLPDTVEDFMDYMKQCVSLSWLNGPAFAKLTTSGTSGGVIVVDRPERFEIGQKVFLYDSTEGLSPAGYVGSIIMDTATITLYTDRGLGTTLNVAGWTTGNTAKVYFDGSQSNGLTSLKLSCLSAANSGTTTLYGQTKTAYPYLQAINVNGATSTAATILEDIFNAYTTIKNRGKGDPNKAVMSYLRLGYVMTLLEQQKGAYHIDQKGTRVNAFGWTEITVFGVKGRLDIVGIQEMDDDYILFLDLRAMKIFTNGFFRKRINPDGREYFEVRNTTGYQYIIDICMFGDIVLLRPSYCGILYGLL